MNLSESWAGMGTRVAIVAEGSYHAGVAANLHSIARIAAACLLCIMVIHGIEKLIERYCLRCHRKPEG